MVVALFGELLSWRKTMNSVGHLHDYTEHQYYQTTVLSN